MASHLYNQFHRVFPESLDPLFRSGEKNKLPKLAQDAKVMGDMTQLIADTAHQHHQLIDSMDILRKNHDRHVDELVKTARCANASQITS